MAECYYMVGRRILGHRPLFPKLRAAALSRKGLLHVRDVWLPGINHFVFSKSVATRFGLLLHEFNSWELLCQRMLLLGQRFLIQRNAYPDKEEWIGFYTLPFNPTSLWVAQGGTIPAARLSSQLQVLLVPPNVDLFIVFAKSKTLSLALTIPSEVQAFVEQTQVV